MFHHKISYNRSITSPSSQERGRDEVVVCMKGDLRPCQNVCVKWSLSERCGNTMYSPVWSLVIPFFFFLFCFCLFGKQSKLCHGTRTTRNFHTSFRHAYTFSTLGIRAFLPQTSSTIYFFFLHTFCSSTTHSRIQFHTQKFAHNKNTFTMTQTHHNTLQII
jgi:hypothetical protein